MASSKVLLAIPAETSRARSSWNSSSREPGGVRVLKGDFIHPLRHSARLDLFLRITLPQPCKTCQLDPVSRADAVTAARTGSIAGAAVRYGVSASSLQRHMASGHQTVDLQGVQPESLTEITSHRERLLAEIRILKAAAPTLSETLRIIDAESKLLERQNSHGGMDLVAMRAEIAAMKQEYEAIKRVIIATSRDHPDWAKTLSNQARQAGLTKFADALRPLFKE